jgi:serine phosphatase RsbU (regulator of sigma subunit)
MRHAAVSMSWIVTVSTVALIAVAVIGMAVVHDLVARRALAHEVQDRVLLEARNLALASAEPLLADFPELALHPLVNSIKSQNPELEVVLVLDGSGTIQGDPDAGGLGTKFEDQRFRPEKTTVGLTTGEALIGDARFLVATASIDKNGRHLGSAVVGLRRDYVGQRLASGRREQALALVFVLALGGVASFLVMSLVLMPVGALRAGLERMGRGDLKTPLRLKNATELGMLADAVNDMAAGLSRAQSEVIERECVSHEADLARQIQSSLLPKQRTEAGEFVVEGSQRAATEVGGDYFDHFMLPDGTIGLAIADVAGKGLNGCMVLSLLSGLLRAYRNSHRSPAELLAQIDERLTETLKPGTFVTMFYGVLDPDTGTLTYASAGHGPLLVFRGASGKSEWLKSSGVPLGATRDGGIRKTLTDATVQIEHGDLVVQFTDGVHEACDSKRERFGFDRMARIVESSARHGCSAVIAGLRQAVEEWAGGDSSGDDETVIVVSREGKPAAPRKPDLKLVPPAEARTMAGAPPTESASAASREPRTMPRLEVASRKPAPVSGGDTPLELELGPPRIWDGRGKGSPPPAPPASSSNATTTGAERLSQATPQDQEIETRAKPWEVVDSVGQLEGLESDRSRTAMPQSAPPKPAEPPKASAPAQSSQLSKPSEMPKPRMPAPPLSIVPRDDPSATLPPATPSNPRAEATPGPRPPVIATGPVHGEALNVLETARVEGRFLSLQAAFHSLVSLRTWTAALYPPGTISDHRFQLLSTALYEACANIVEHGCGLDPQQVFEVFWLPVADETDQPAWLESGFLGESSPGASTRGPGSSQCRFVIRDHGIPFAADNWKATDFSNPEVWKRGRGFGMDIIHKVMKRVAYFPGTPEGNLTLMEFDSNEVPGSSGEQRHVR